MKVDRNQLVPNVELYNGDSAIGFFGVPLRLEIAVRLMSNGMPDLGGESILEKAMCYRMLRLADLLIEKHNETCGVGPDDEIR